MSKLYIGSLKGLLVSAPVLVVPEPSKHFIVQTDASKAGLRAVLSQRGPDEQMHPTSYASCKVHP